MNGNTIKQSTLLFVVFFSYSLTIANNSCKDYNCDVSECLDIFGGHYVLPCGALDIKQIDENDICTFEIYYDWKKNKVIGDTVGNKVVLSAKAFMDKNNDQGACVFSPFGPYYCQEGKWTILPYIFRKALYSSNKGNLNCLIHLYIPSGGALKTYLILDGFWVGDNIDKVYKRYGEPFYTKKFDDGVIAYAFKKEEKSKTYLAVEVLPYDTSNIWSLQLSGSNQSRVKGVNGINLGTSKNELIRSFGKPTKEDTLEDIPGTLLIYDNTNCTFEVNEDKIFSIKITLPGTLESWQKYLNH